jgi:hypothetical protein
MSGEHAVTIPTYYGRLTGIYLLPSLTPVEVKGVL